MLNEVDLQEWLELLAPTIPERIYIINDLLAHAYEDGMSEADKLDCARGLDLLAKTPSPPTPFAAPIGNV